MVFLPRKQPVYPRFGGPSGGDGHTSTAWADPEDIVEVRRSVSLIFEGCYVPEQVESERHEPNVNLSLEVSGDHRRVMRPERYSSSGTSNVAKCELVTNRKVVNDCAWAQPTWSDVEGNAAGRARTPFTILMSHHKLLYFLSTRNGNHIVPGPSPSDWGVWPGGGSEEIRKSDW